MHTLIHTLADRPLLLEPGYARSLMHLLRHDAAPQPEAQAATDIEPQLFTPYRTADGIAVIPVYGLLMHRLGALHPLFGMTGYDAIQAKLDAALSDPAVRGIVLDIDSPGGEVSGCFDLADSIYQGRQIKPIWAVADEFACSAAYALASACTRIIAPRTARAGSVGVVVMHIDVSGALQDGGINVTLIQAGARKTDGNPFEPLPDNVRADIQADIDSVYDLFVSTVARNRNTADQTIRDTEARIYTGQATVAAGLVDEVMPARDVLDQFNLHMQGKRPLAGTGQVTQQVQTPPENPLIAAVRNFENNPKRLH